MDNYDLATGVLDSWDLLYPISDTYKDRKKRSVRVGNLNLISSSASILLKETSYAPVFNSILAGYYPVCGGFYKSYPSEYHRPRIQVTVCPKFPITVANAHERRKRYKKSADYSDHSISAKKVYIFVPGKKKDKNSVIETTNAGVYKETNYNNNSECIVNSYFKDMIKTRKKRSETTKETENPLQTIPECSPGCANMNMNKTKNISPNRSGTASPVRPSNTTGTKAETIIKKTTTLSQKQISKSPDRKSLRNDEAKTKSPIRSNQQKTKTDKIQKSESAKSPERFSASRKRSIESVIAEEKLKSPDRYGISGVDTSSPDRITITGRLGLTEDDQCILKCDATLNDKPIPTQFHGIDCALLPLCYEACNEEFRSLRKQRDAKVQAKESPMGARFHTPVATGKESQGTQVDFQLTYSTAIRRSEESSRDKIMHKCNCVNTVDNAREIYDNKEDAGVAVWKHHSPLIVNSTAIRRSEESSRGKIMHKCNCVNTVDNAREIYDNKEDAGVAVRKHHSPLIVNSTAIRRSEESSRGKIMHKCNCVNTVDNAREIYDNKEDAGVAARKHHNPLIVISVYPKTDESSENSSDAKPASIKAKDHKKEVKKIGRSRSPSPRKNSKKIVEKKSDSRVNASTSKKTVHETARKVTRSKLNQTQSRSPVRTTSSKTKTESKTIKSRSPKVKRTPPQSRQSNSPPSKQKDENGAEQLKRALIEDFTKTYTEHINNRNTHLDIPLPTKHNVSNITIDIEGDSEYYNVKLEQDNRKLNTKLTVRKPSKGPRTGDNNTVYIMGETDTTSLENFLYMPENEHRKRSFSQTLMYDGTGLTMDGEDDEGNTLNVKDSIEVSHRRETKASNDVAYEVDTKNLAQIKHFRGDDCSIPNPVIRDREIKKLLGIEKGVGKKNKNKPSQVQVINVNNYHIEHNTLRTIYIARSDHMKPNSERFKQDYVMRTESVKDVQYRKTDIRKQRVRFSSSDSANYLSRAEDVQKMDTGSIQTIFKHLDHRKSATPNLGTSACTLSNSSVNIGSRFKLSEESMEEKPKKPFLKRLISCLVFKISPVSQTKHPRVLIDSGTPNSSFDSYYISTSLGAIEMSSSLYGTSASFYSDHSVPTMKIKRGFLSSVRGLLTRKS
ncbi:uncharacterized protein LOC134674877 [Cydia fagiglandana]|uniref:uncharacterized protein LOC134674877 n=1 Tax=Cydia fagiglandana TaxID=1458189 RepID=UPI002FEE0213